MESTHHHGHRFLILAGIFGFLGVATGAFGAHALKDRLPEDLLTIFNTGSRYCLEHAIALAMVSFAYIHTDQLWLRRACWGFTLGILIFSGSLWILALTNTRWLGAITPLGGVGFLMGWLSIVFYALSPNKQHVITNS